MVGQLGALPGPALTSLLPPQQWTSSINRTNKMALLAWVRETGIDLVQVNGQRRYGGPPPGGCQQLGVVLPGGVPAGGALTPHPCACRVGGQPAAPGL